MPILREAPRRLILLAVLLAVLSTLLSASTAEPEPAPRFHVKTLGGELFDNQSLRGKVVLLQFWTTWCPYCRREQPLVDEIQQELGPKGLVVLAVNVAESKKTVRKYLEEHPRSCRVVLNDDTNLPAMFESKGFPLYVLIDREGNVIARQDGAGGKDSLLFMLSKAGLVPLQNGSDDEWVPKPEPPRT